MKIRNGFVTNSSSSSFIISKRFLAPYQIELIKEHEDRAWEVGMHCGQYDGWSVSDEGDYLDLYTTMDNFDMAEYLEKIGVNPKLISWNWRD